MVSRPGTPRHPLTRSYAIAEATEHQPAMLSTQSMQDHRPSIDERQLNQLAACFEKFFWRPTDKNRKQLMTVISEIRQNANALQGLDASTLVSRILHCKGLFDIDAAPELLDLDDIRSAVSATLECLAGTRATLFNVGAPSSLAQLLPTAKENDLLPELAALIAGDLALCGEHRVIESIWNHAEQSGLSLLTLMILIQLSEHLGYPISEDIRIVDAARLIRDWCHQSPTDDDMADFDSCLCGMTDADTSPEDFEKLLKMALNLGFDFTDESLAKLIGLLIHQWEKYPQQDQYGMKLHAVLQLTGLSANNLFIDGERALHKAAHTGHYRLLVLLLDHGADPDQTNTQQKIASSPLLRKREDLMTEIADIVKAQNQFTRHQYKLITSRLLLQLNRNERMLVLLDTARQNLQRRAVRDTENVSD